MALLGGDVLPPGTNKQWWWGAELSITKHQMTWRRREELEEGEKEGEEEGEDGERLGEAEEYRQLINRTSPSCLCE